MDESEKDMAQARWEICMPYWLFWRWLLGLSRSGFGDGAVFYREADQAHWVRWMPS